MGWHWARTARWLQEPVLMFPWARRSSVWARPQMPFYAPQMAPRRRKTVRSRACRELPYPPRWEFILL
jgi:hypothetical protein